MLLIGKFQGAVREITEAHTAYLEAKNRGLDDKTAATVVMLVSAKQLDTHQLMAAQKAIVSNPKADLRVRVATAAMLADTLPNHHEAATTRKVALELAKQLPQGEDREGLIRWLECLQMMRLDREYDAETFCNNVLWLLMFPLQEVAQMALFAIIKDQRPHAGDIGRAKLMLERLKWHLNRVPRAYASLEDQRHIELITVQLRFAR